MYYALHVGGGSGVVRGKGDGRGLMRVLATLPNCQAQRAFEDPFLHTLVYHIYYIFSIILCAVVAKIITIIHHDYILQIKVFK